METMIEVHLMISSLTKRCQHNYIFIEKLLLILKYSGLTEN